MRKKQKGKKEKARAEQENWPRENEKIYEQICTMNKKDVEKDKDIKSLLFMRLKHINCDSNSIKVMIIATKKV